MFEIHLLLSFWVGTYVGSMVVKLYRTCMLLDFYILHLHFAHLFLY